MLRLAAAFSIALAIVAAACSSSSMPASPSPSAATPNTVSGSWSGTSADSSGQEKLTWTITQSGTSVTGMMSLSDTARGMTGNGTMSGTMNGNVLTFHMDVPTGGFGGAMAPCSMGVDGRGTMSDDGRTITGTYSGVMSGMMSGGMMTQPQACGAAMNNGQFTLTR